ncbi:MAG: hypothetical protein V1861_05700 [Candidatus Micrarchaeota archaeon]
MVKKLEGGTGGTPASKPEVAKPNSRYFGLKNALAITAGVGAIAALIAFRSCPGGQDRLVPAPAPAPTATAVTCPTPQANTCNLALGEHDPHSTNWAPTKCGYCGDGITEGQPWETPQNCPVDFHCGDGVCQLGPAIYGAYIRPTIQGGVYTLGTMDITETNDPNSPGVCEADCGRGGAPPPAPVGSGRRTDRRGPRDEPRPVVTAAPPATTGCPAEVTGRIQPRVSSSLTGNPAAARSAAGADSSTVVRARVSIRVTNGVPTVTSISLSCPGGACAGGSMSAGSINLAGIPLGNTTCSDVVPVIIPPG